MPVIVRPKNQLDRNGLISSSRLTNTVTQSLHSATQSLGSGSRASFKCGGERAGFKSWTQFSTVVNHLYILIFNIYCLILMFYLIVIIIEVAK